MSSRAEAFRNKNSIEKNEIHNDDRYAVQYRIPHTQLYRTDKNSRLVPRPRPAFHHFHFPYCNQRKAGWRPEQDYNSEENIYMVFLGRSFSSGGQELWCAFKCSCV